MQIFREGLLEGRSIALHGPVPVPVKNLLEALGAQVHEHTPDRRSVPPLDALVCAESAGHEDLLAPTWTAVHAVASDALIPAKSGRIVLLAPREDLGVVKAALENLARTLSVEWARYGITATAIVPGPKTTDDELATLVAYLCSEAGAYFSGCRFDVR
jgi:hypothetical protein